MKKRVSLSKYCIIISFLYLLLTGILQLFMISSASGSYGIYILPLFIILLITPLLYAPVYVRADNSQVIVKRPLKNKYIPVAMIESVELCQPTMGERKICGSGGAFGYYGWYSERDLGRYFAYYGKASECFLLTMKNGKKYMLGCKDTSEMVKYISSHI